MDLSADLDAIRAALGQTAAATPAGTRRRRSRRHAEAEFIARVGHELRAPLTAVLGFAQLLQADERTALSPRQAEYAQRILGAARHLAALIDDVLDLSRVHAGRFPLTCETVDLVAVARQAVVLVEAQAAAQGVALRADLPETAVLAHGDGRRLTQVAVNLLSNAIKYNRPGGWVTLNVGPGPLLQVRDGGLGMTREQQSHLFEPFNRLGREGGPADGTGIGLTLCRELLTRMGGKLTLASAPDHGTTATVQLPTATSPPTATVSGATPATPGTPDGTPLRQVLCIDDNPVNCLLVSEYLKLAPQAPEVLTALTGREGLALARQHRPQVVLLDLQLPDLSGFDVLAALRADPATRDIPVAIASGSVDALEQQQALAQGAQACWTKPLDLGRLAGDLAALLATPAS